MIIGIPREILANEYRVPLLPVDVKRISSDKLKFLIEHDAGLRANCPDSLYKNAGALLTSDINKESELILL